MTKVTYIYTAKDGSTKEFKTLPEVKAMIEKCGGRYKASYEAVPQDFGKGFGYRVTAVSRSLYESKFKNSLVK